MLNVLTNNGREFSFESDRSAATSINSATTKPNRAENAKPFAMLAGCDAAAVDNALSGAL